jgi:glyoxylase I family protein
MRIHHVALRTGDLAALERFYGGVLGLRVTRRQGERSTWLSAGDAIVMLERRDPGEPELGRGSMELVAFAVPPGSHEELVRRLAAAGIAVEARTASTLYVRDPDGRRVGLSAYPEPLGG